MHEIESLVQIIKIALYHLYKRICPKMHEDASLAAGPCFSGQQSLLLWYLMRIIGYLPTSNSALTFLQRGPVEPVPARQVSRLKTSLEQWGPVDPVPGRQVSRASTIQKKSC